MTQVEELRTADPAGSNEVLEASLAVLVAHARKQRPLGGDRELLARAIARLAVHLSAPRTLDHPIAADEDEVVVVAEPEEIRYEVLVARMHEVVSRVVPVGARVAIVSRGDSDLLRIPGLDNQHFPSTRDGRYAGFYPADGKAALAQLEDAIHSGIAYLAIPETGRWWLDFYAEFGAFLRSECRTLVDDPGVGAVFELVTSTQEGN